MTGMTAFRDELVKYNVKHGYFKYGKFIKLGIIGKCISHSAYNAHSFISLKVTFLVSVFLCCT